MVCCFTVSLFFNAYDVTTKLAPDAPSPRRIKKLLRKTLTTDPSDFHHTSANQATCTGGAELHELKRGLFALSPIPKQRRREKLSAAKCCSSLIASIDPYPFHSPRCTHFPARSWNPRRSRTPRSPCTRPPEICTRSCVLRFIAADWKNSLRHRRKRIFWLSA